MRAVLLCLWAVVGLATAASQCAAQGSVELASEFSLRVGRSLRVSGTDVTVRVERIENDSRCPQGAQCITAGDADVVVSLAIGRDRREHHLHTGTEQRSATQGAYRIELLDVTPTPAVDRPVPPRDYVARLRIDRVDPR